MVLLRPKSVSFLVSMHHEIGDLLTGLGHVMSCVFEFVHCCRAGADIRLHVWINIPSLDGGGTDLLRLQSTAKDGHRTGGEDVAVKAVDVYSGIAELRISVDANMGFLSISGECDLFLVFMEEGVFDFDPQILGRLIHDRDQLLGRSDLFLHTAIAVDQQMFSDKIIHSIHLL
mgnify:CR=1 FL=1